MSDSTTCSPARPGGIRRRLALVAAVSVVMTGLAPLAGADAAAPAAATPGYQGSAFGSSVTVLGAIESAPTASIIYGCGTPAGLSRQESSVGINVPPGTVTTGVINTTGATTTSPTQSKTTASVSSVNVLGGLITAGTLTAASASKVQGSNYSTSAAGSRFAGLKVLGLPVLLGPSPNTRIDLPGVGYVVLNEQTRQVTGSSAALRVTALRAKVTVPNLLGFDVGTEIVVAQAFSKITAPQAGFLSGFAYGTSADIGPLLSSAPTFRATLPCQGTNGRETVRQGVGVDIPGILDSGTIRDTVTGTVSATAVSGTATSSVEDANLLDGLVTATGIVSSASASKDAGGITLSDDGTMFASVTVAGQSIAVVDVAPNTTIDLVGVGTVTLNRQISTARTLEVRAIEIKVLQGNIFGLPLGSTILVGVAKAGVK